MSIQPFAQSLLSDVRKRREEEERRLRKQRERQELMGLGLGLAVKIGNEALANKTSNFLLNEQVWNANQTQKLARKNAASFYNIQSAVDASGGDARSWAAKNMMPEFQARAEEILADEFTGAAGPYQELVRKKVDELADQWAKDYEEALQLSSKIASEDDYNSMVALNAKKARPNDIASILRDLSNKKVINLGYKANGPLSMYASLKEYKSKKIQNIIWMYYEGNDLTDLIHELTIKNLNQYLEDKSFFQNLMEKQDYIDKQNQKILIKSIRAWDNAREQSIKNSSIKYKVLKFIRLDKSKNFIKKISQSKKKTLPLKEFETILNHTKNIADDKNAKMHFVYLPQFERYKSKLRDDNFFEIKKIVANLNINFIDIDKEVFQKEKDPLGLFPFRNWGHYNEEGYRRIGEALFKKIENSN